MPEGENDVASPPPAREELLPVGEVSRRTGVAVSALHYYEKIGLIAARRTAGNQRRYPRHMLRRIALVTVAGNLGIPLADVREAFAALPAAEVPSGEDWQEVARRWKAALEQRRRVIEQLEEELTGCIGCGCLSMTACRLANPEDRLGMAGPGPRYLKL